MHTNQLFFNIYEIIIISSFCAVALAIQQIIRIEIESIVLIENAHTNYTDDRSNW